MGTSLYFLKSVVICIHSFICIYSSQFSHHSCPTIGTRFSVAQYSLKHTFQNVRIRIKSIGNFHDQTCNHESPHELAMAPLGLNVISHLEQNSSIRMDHIAQVHLHVFCTHHTIAAAYKSVFSTGAILKQQMAVDSFLRNITEIVKFKDLKTTSIDQ